MPGLFPLLLQMEPLWQPCVEHQSHRASMRWMAGRPMLRVAMGATVNRGGAMRACPGEVGMYRDGAASLGGSSLAWAVGEEAAATPTGRRASVAMGATVNRGG